MSGEACPTRVRGFYVAGHGCLGRPPGFYNVCPRWRKSSRVWPVSGDEKKKKILNNITLSRTVGLND